MPQGARWGRSLGRRPWRAGVVACLALALSGCATISKEEKQTRREWLPLPRWYTDEVPYEQAGAVDRFGRNLRDGVTGIIDNAVQGAYSILLIGPTSGFLVQKLAVIGGDLIGLIDDNDLTEHVFRGLLSRQLLRFGATQLRFLETLGHLHRDQPFVGPQRGIKDFVGDTTFHTAVYGPPSAIFVLGGVVIADFVVRPAGNVVRIFQWRSVSEKIDKAGIDLIQKSAEIPFL